MRFAILGPLEVLDDGQPVPLGAGRQRKLLAILLLHPNEAVSIDRLIEELWGEPPPETAGKALQGHISQLRKRLGPDSVLTVANGYAVKVDPADLDAYVFERLLYEAGREPPEPAARKLREAFALWRGPPLADFAYDDFARNEIDRLDELRLTSVEKLIDADLALGRQGDVIAELESLVAAHPLRERFRAQLMLALYRSGRQAEALQVYQDARAALRDELGLEPSDELQALQKAILAHDESLAAPPRMPFEEDGPRPPAKRPRALPRRRPLVAAGLLLLLGAIAAATVELAGGNGSKPVAVSADSVAVIDASKRVVADVPVGARPIAIAIGAGGVWVANADEGTVTRLDPKTRKVVARIGIGADVSDIAIGFGSVWVADGNDGTVTRIDPRLNAVEATLDFGSKTQLLPNAVFSIAVDDKHVWATRGGQLLRIDPRTDEADRHLDVGTPIGLATGGGAVWLTTLSEQLLRIDPGTAKVAASTTLPTQGLAPVFDRQALWVITNLGHGEVERLDPNSLTATATTSLGDSPTNLTADGGKVWASIGNGTIAEIDAASANRTAVGHVGAYPTSLAAGDGTIWVAVATPGTT